jgi:hypothetical protein
MSREFFGMKRRINMGIKEMTTELKEEIKKTEEKLVQLRQIEAIVNGMQFPAKESREFVSEILPDAVPFGNVKKMRRKLKYAKFTPTETKQIINMWNSMKDIPNMNQQTIVSQIARVLKQPYKRVYSKVFWLKRTGHIAIPQGMFTGRIMPTVVKERTIAKNFFYWSDGQKQQLKQLIAQRKMPKEIAEMMGIGIRIVSNKINRMKASGEIPKARSNQTDERIIPHIIDYR